MKRTTITLLILATCYARAASAQDADAATATTQDDASTPQAAAPAQTAPPEPPATPGPPASTPPASAVVATPPEHTPAWYERLRFEGLVDTYFMANLSAHSGAPVSLRVFDTQAASFTLAYAEVAMQLPAEPVGFRIDLGLGPVASITGPANAPFRDVLVPIQQAYATLKIPGASWLAIDAGKFVTTAGFEVIEARNNWNYSRSLLFGYAIPFTHTGLRATATIGSHFTAQASIVNGWDVVIDNNSGKTFGIAGTYDSGAGTTAAVTAYAGPERAGNDHDWRVLVDGVVAQALGPRWDVALNADVAYEMPGVTWWGVAGYVRFKPLDALRLALRAEYLSDLQGTRLGITMPSPGGMSAQVPANVFETTLTLGVPVADHLELRGEYRIDAANIAAFRDGTSSVQQTLSAAALAWF